MTSALKNWVNEDWIDFVLSHSLIKGRKSTLALGRTLARVVAVRDETPDMKTFVVRPNRNWTGFKPGQFVPVRIQIGGIRHERYYSLTSEPDSADVSFCVKRVDDGRVSNWMHDHLHIGDVIELGEASGEFLLADDDRPLLFIAAGSGITPIFSLVREAARRDPDRDLVLLYYARTPADFAFRKTLQMACDVLPSLRVHFIAKQANEFPSGRFSAKHLDAFVPDCKERLTYLCGPNGLMQTVEAYWASLNATGNLRLERFAPPALFDDRATPSAVVPVHFRRSQQTVEHAASSLLETAEQAGLRPASGCRMGICKTCACTKVSGVTRDKITGEINREPSSTIRICVSEPLGPVTLDL